MAVKIDMSDLTSLPNRLKTQLIKGLVPKAVEFTLVQGAGKVKERLTAQEQVRTGNLRNSIGWTKVRISGGKIEGSIIAGQRVSNLNFVDQKTGKTAENISQPVDYAQHVEAKKPYMEPERPVIRKLLAKNMQAAVSAFVNKENSR